MVLYPSRSGRARKIAVLAVAALSVLLFVVAGVIDRLPATAATSSTLNFQARILSNAGSVVPDGYYNVQFKLYDGGTQGGGVGAGEANAGTLLWTESYYDSNGATAGNDNRLRVVNGYFSANLGSQTAFGSLNWDQEMWLTMNIGGATQTATPTYDGEMLATGSKRTKLTGVPYAFQAGELKKDTGSGNSTLVTFATPSGAHTVTIPAATGTICLQNAAACGFATGSGTAFLQGGNSFGGTATLGTSDNNGLNIRTNSTTVLTLSNNGEAFFKNGADSATAFRIQNAAATQTLLTVDTTARGVGGGNLIKIGDSTGTDTSLTILQVDAATANPTSNLSALNGGIFYNSTTNKLSIIENGSVKVLCNTTDLACGTGGGGTLQGSYDADADGSDAIIALTTADDSLIFRNPATSGTDSGYVLTIDQLATGAVGGLDIQSAGTGNLLRVRDTTVTARDVLVIADGGAAAFRNQTDSTTAFQVQNAAGSSIFSVNTTDGEVNIDGNGSYVSLNIDSAAGQSRDLIWQSSGVDRWILRTNGTAEGGSNAGSDFEVISRDDTGAALGTPLKFTRSNGSALFKNSTDSTTAFQIQNAAGTSNLFVADTTNTRVGIGIASPETTIHTRVANSTDAVLRLDGDTSNKAGILLTESASGAYNNGFSLQYDTSANTLDLRAINAGTSSVITTIARSTGALTYKNVSDSTTAFQIQNSSSHNLLVVNTSNGRVQVGGGTTDTVLVLDSATSAPTGTAGAMYYDSTNSKFKCFTSSWVDCNAASGGQARKETLVPEFPGATLTPDGSSNVGTMTTDFCSNGNTNPPNLNTGVCTVSGDLHNYYSWTANATNDYDVWVNWQVPSDFTAFASSPAINFYGWRTSTSDAVTLTVYDDNNAVCGSATAISGTVAQWNLTNYATASGCGSIAAGDIITFRIQLSVGVNGEFARIGKIEVNYVN